MESHAATMRRLMEDRERRQVKISVNKLAPDELAVELEERRCSTRGSPEILRDRLIRQIIREVEPDNQSVPWYEWDPARVDAREGREESVPEEFRDQVVRKKKKQAAREKRATVLQRRAHSDTSTEYGVIGEAVAADVEVHRTGAGSTPRNNSPEVVSTPVFTPVTTSVLTTIARSDQSVAVTTTSSSAAWRHNGAVVSSSGIAPRVTGRVQLSRFVLAPSQLQSSQWSYYSARMIRGEVPASLVPTEPSLHQNAIPPSDRTEKVLGGAQTERRQVDETPVRSNREKSRSDTRRWFTPAQDLDAIRGASSSSSVASGSESSRNAEVPSQAVKGSYRDVASDLDTRHGAERFDERNKPIRTEPPRSFQGELGYLSNGGERTACVGGSRREPEPQRTEPSMLRNARDRDVYVRRKEPVQKQRGAADRLEWDGYVPGYTSHCPSESDEESYTSRKRHRARCERDVDDERGNAKPRLGDAHRGSRWTREREPSVEPPAYQKQQAVKSLRAWGVKFSGDDKSEDPEEFLEQIEDCRAGSGISDAALLVALPCCLTKKAAQWYRTIRDEIASWAEFCRVFRKHYVKVYDREDLLEDLHRRTQAEGEKITSYLSSFKYIISRFRKPPPYSEQVELAYRKLHPTYRAAFGDKIVETLDDIERYGRLYERMKDLDLRYTPPPSADKMRVPGAAYTGSRKSKVAAVVDEEAAAVVSAPGGKKGKGKGKNKGGNISANQEKAATVEEQTEFVEEKQPASYAAAAQGLAAGQAKANAPAPQPSGKSPYRHDVRYESAAWPNAGQNYPTRGEPLNKSLDQRNDAQWKSPGYQRPSDAGARAGARGGEFVGACYTCQRVGHRASECPEIKCFSCHEKGHTSRNCPEKRYAKEYRDTDRDRRPRDACQNCNRPDVTFKTCPACAPLRSSLGNGKGGGLNLNY